jgi:hypothetical protein
MGISTIRKATEEDYERLEKAAVRFVKRHDIDLSPVWDGSLPGNSPAPTADALHSYLDDARHDDPWNNNGRYLWKLWIDCFRRAVDESTADAIGYGYIGWSA